MDAREINILTINSATTLKLNHQELEMILTQPEYKDMPIYIVSVAGTYRKGKSFLLNYFIRYLEHRHYAVNRLGPPGAPLTGFQWGPGRRRVTNGITIWSKPYIIERENDESLVVLLMDTEGTQDVRNDMTIDVRIFALSLVISNMQINSLSGQFESRDLDYLRIFSEFAQSLLESSEASSQLQDLLFLVRDWNFPQDCGFGFEGGQILFDDLVKNDQKDPTIESSTYKILKENFKNVRTFLLPHPGSQIGDANFKGSVNQLKPDYVKYLHELCEAIFDPKLMAPKHMNGNPITCGKFVYWLKQYSELFQSTQPPTKASVYEMVTRSRLDENVQHCLTMYKELMEKNFFSTTDFINIEGLREAHKEIETHVKTEFYRMSPVGNKEYVDEYANKLQSQLELLYNESERNLLKNLEANKRLQSMILLEGMWHTFVQQSQQMAHDSATDGMAATDFQSKLQLEANKFKSELELTALRKNLSVESQQLHELDRWIETHVEEMMKLFKKLKTSRCAGISVESMSMYQQRMDELMLKAKAAANTVDFEKENNDAIEKVMSYFYSCTNDVDEIEKRKSKVDLEAQLNKLSIIYRDQMKYLTGIYFANLNDKLIEKCVEKYNEYQWKEFIEEHALNQYDQYHRQRVKIIAAEFEANCGGQQSMKEQCRINLHARLIRCYHESHPDLVNTDEWNNRTFSIQLWHENTYLDGRAGLLNEFRYIETKIVEDTAEEHQTRKCSIL